MDQKTGTLNAHIGDTFTLSFSENLAGQTVAPFLGAGINDVGWLVDATLDASIKVPDIPDVVVNSVTTQDSRSITLDYTVNTMDLPAPLRDWHYRSSNSTLDAENLDLESNPKTGQPYDEQVGGLVDLPAADDMGGSSLAQGEHVVTVAMPDAGLVIDPAHPFVFAAANPDEAVEESDYSNNVGDFETHVITVITPGFSATGAFPDWVPQMVASLTDEGLNDGVNNLTISDNWSARSNLPFPGIVAQEGQALAEELVQLANEFPLPIPSISTSSGTAAGRTSTTSPSRPSPQTSRSNSKWVTSRRQCSTPTRQRMCPSAGSA